MIRFTTRQSCLTGRISHLKNLLPRHREDWLRARTPTTKLRNNSNYFVLDLRRDTPHVNYYEDDRPSTHQQH